MASEAVVSDHSTNEQVEKKIIQETKTIELDGVHPSEENRRTDVEQKQIVTESASSASLGTISEANVEVNQIGPPVGEKLKVAENPSPESDTSTFVPEPAAIVFEKLAEEQAATEATEKQPEEQLATETIEKQLEKKAAIEDTEKEPERQSVTEPIEKQPEEKLAIEATEKQPEQQSATEVFEKQPEDKPSIEAVVKQPEQQPATEVFEKQPGEKPSIEAIEKQPEEQPETEAVDKQPEKPEIEAIEKRPEEQVAKVAVERQPEEQPAIESVEKQPQDQPVTEAAEKQPQDKPAIQSVEKQSEKQETISNAPENVMEHSEVSPPKESEPKVVQKTEEVSEAEAKITEKSASIKEVHENQKEQVEVADQVEKKPEELKPKGSEGEIATDEETPANQDTQTYPKEDGGDSLPDVVKETCVEDAKKEDGGVVFAEGLSKEAGVEEGNIKEQKEEKNLEVDEENEEKIVKNEESSVEEKVFGVDEVVTEKKREEKVEGDIPALAETKDKDVEEKVEDISTATTVDEPVDDSKKSKLEMKMKETIKAVDDKLEKTKEIIGEIAKSDAQNLESSKDTNELKKIGETPKEEVPVKSTQKQSNNMISKVKHSLVKVKKAIMGKSPSSKTLSSEVKGDIKVKS